MEMEKFLELVSQLNAAYRGRNGLEKEDEIKLYYRALNDIRFESLQKAVGECIKNIEYFPSIATIRKYVVSTSYCDWSIQWVAVQDKIETNKLNEAAQYAIKVLGLAYVNNMISLGKSGQVMGTFKELYEKYIFHEGSYIKTHGLEDNFKYPIPKRYEIGRDGTCYLIEEGAVELEEKPIDYGREDGQKEVEHL